MVIMFVARQRRPNGYVLMVPTDGLFSLRSVCALLFEDALRLLYADYCFQNDIEDLYRRTNDRGILILQVIGGFSRHQPPLVVYQYGSPIAQLRFTLSCIFSLKTNQIHWGKAVLPCCVLLLCLDKSIVTSIHVATPLWH